MRREFTAKVKVAAYERSGGACEACGARLQPGRIHYDHAIPDALGGEPTLANCAVLCTACHKVKTARQDVPSIARAKRLQAKHIGAKPPSRWRKPSGVRFDWRQGRYVKEATK
jgi:5-methylcytosine-specific restriction endonuclease McrA